jgi:catechol 2,3-dioxygenase-like lactoylglutathione lyase family enzyme
MLGARFYHVNVNTCELGPAERFYGEGFGRQVGVRTAPTEGQDGSGFGLAGQSVRWEGVILIGGTRGQGPLVDLLQWLEPPTGLPARPGPSALGHAGFLFGVPDLSRAAETLAEAGGRCFAGRRTDGSTEPVVVVLDPDDTRVELTTRGTPAMTGVRVNCSDIDRAARFYEAVGMSVGPARPVEITVDDGPAAAGGGRFVARSASLDDSGVFSLELAQWRDPAPTGVPPAGGHHVGIYRVAIMVDDVDAEYREIRRQVPGLAPPVDVDVGPDLPVVRALFFPDPDGTIIELIGRRAP